MRNFTELTKAEREELFDMLPHEMSEEQKVQYCQFVQDRYKVSDYFEEHQMIERLEFMLRCHAEINKENLSPEEKATLRVLFDLLDTCSGTLYRLFYDMY